MAKITTNELCVIKSFSDLWQHWNPLESNENWISFVDRWANVIQFLLDCDGNLACSVEEVYFITFERNLQIFKYIFYTYVTLSHLTSRNHPDYTFVCSQLAGLSWATSGQCLCLCLIWLWDQLLLTWFTMYEWLGIDHENCSGDKRFVVLAVLPVKNSWAKVRTGVIAYSPSVFNYESYPRPADT